MISGEDCEFIKKFEVSHSEQKQAILTNEGHQVGYDHCVQVMSTAFKNNFIQHFQEQKNSQSKHIEM